MTKLIQRLFPFALLLLVTHLNAQQGGMWIPSLLEGMNETEMQSLGSKMSAKDIYDVNNSSLKDAIVHFNGGCTAELISSKGLLLTNHHCGYGEIQSHSSLENDYIKNGFWAERLEDELANEDLYVDFIVRIDDVTEKVLSGIGENLDEAGFQKQIAANIEAVQKSAKKEEWQKTKVRAFYKGNQYFLFVIDRFEDVRLVGAPPASIGKFGSDTDNWMFPRHTGDFSLFRIYADKNNRPAKYSKDNVPFVPKHYLPISLDGIAEGDFTMVFGFPGRTNEYLPAVAIEHITKEYNPSNIAIREAALKVIDARMKASDEVRIKYASKQARIANYWKKWIGENQGIENSNAIAKRKELEARFTKELKAKNLNDKYGSILSEFNDLYTEFSPINIKDRNFVEVFLVTNELLKMTFRIYQFEQAITRKPESFEKEKAKLLKQFKSIHKNYDASLDKAVYESVIRFYTNNVNTAIYDKSALVNLTKAEMLLQGDQKTVLKKLNKDAAYVYAKPMVAEFMTTMSAQYNEIDLKIKALQKKYMKALMEVLPEERYFPDANSTLRVTYGEIKGYSPRDAVYYAPVSYLDGVMEKYIPGDYEFDVPEKLRELYANKDYGQYADENGKVPVCFLGTNHTTGGNSGSPAIDAHGNLIGLNFDRVWEGTMSDMNYDPAICRNIMVDIRYVLFIVDKYAGAQRLIDEMDLVHPKKQ